MRPRFALSGRSPLAGLISGSAISLVGSQLTVVALPWFVLQVTGSASAVGAVASVIFLARFVAGVVAGPLVDRLGDRPTSILTDLASGAGVALIPLLYHAYGFVLWQVLLAAVLVGAPDILGMSSRRSLIPELAQDGNVRLERANGLYESVQQFSLLVGAPIGGLLVGWVGASNVMLFDAGSYGLSALIIGLVTRGGRAPVTAKGLSRYVGQLLEGFRYLLRDRVLVVLATSVAASNLIGAASTSVILPLYVKTRFGQPIALGLTVAALGAGSLAGGLVFGAIGHRLPRRPTLILGFTAIPFVYWSLAFGAPLPALMTVAFIVGLAGGALNPMGVTVRQERVPTPLRGRVFSSFSAIVGSTPALGAIVGGVMAQQIGLQAAALALAVAGQLLAGVLLVVPSLRELGPPAGDATPGTSPGLDETS